MSVPEAGGSRIRAYLQFIAAVCYFFLAQSLAKSGEQIDDRLWKPIAASMIFLKGDFEKDETYKQLGDLLTETDKKNNLGGNVLFYMAVADRFFSVIAGKLGISRSAAKERAETLYKRLGVHRRDEAVTKARSLGLIRAIS